MQRGLLGADNTYAARIPVAAAALNPHVRLIVADGGGKDWKSSEPVAHRHHLLTLGVDAWHAPEGRSN